MDLNLLKQLLEEVRTDLAVVKSESENLVKAKSKLDTVIKILDFDLNSFFRLGTGVRGVSFKSSIDSGLAHWEVWGGWAVNPDKRIDGARCSNCGCIHETVKGSLDKLSDVCPICGSHMSVKLV